MPLLRAVRHTAGMKRICCAGEVMVELAATDAPGVYRQGFAGDTLNTAIYLARDSGLRVQYLTRLGDDFLSSEILRFLAREGVETNSIHQVPGRQPGLYMIRNDDAGERHFSYWRNASPARQLFETPLAPTDADAFFFSGITLAVVQGHIDNLCATLQQLQQAGCHLVFDSNYRPALWRDPAAAQAACRRILPYCHTLMATLADDRILWQARSAEALADFYRDQGVREVVVRSEALKATVFHDAGQTTRQSRPVPAVDTTGAGDAFNAGYLAARYRGDPIRQCLAKGQALAARVVQHRGAILPREA